MIKIPVSKPRTDGWCYHQHGGSDPRIRLHYSNDGIHKLTVVIRHDTIYVSHMSTLTLDEWNLMCASVQTLQSRL